MENWRSWTMYTLLKRNAICTVSIMPESVKQCLTV